jgi:MYXO-CTERM domain-containing protein
MRAGINASMALHMLARSALVRSVLTDRRLAAALALGVGLFAVPAAAHVAMLTPMARYSQDHQKNEPCGHPENPPGDGPVAVYQAGETITIEFEEFVDHPGHFRVALDPTGTDNFTSPTAFDDFYNSPEVILDEIPDVQGGGMGSIQVTLPDTPCEACTLQLMQVMTDGAFGPGTSDLYFQCADIVIEGASAETADLTTGADESGGEESSGGGGGSTGSDPDSGGGSEGGEGSSSGPGNDEGSTSGASAGTDTTGPADADDGEGGCSCRADAGSTGAAPWLLVALLAWRRRRG